MKKLTPQTRRVMGWIAFAGLTLGIVLNWSKVLAILSVVFRAAAGHHRHGHCVFHQFAHARL